MTISIPPARRGALMTLSAILAFAALPPTQPALAGDDDHVVALMYHRFGEEEYPSTSVELAQFDAHLAEIARAGHTVMTLGEVVDAWERGEDIPDNAIALTVDDGYSSVLREGWPRMKAAGLRFTLFVSTDPSDRNVPGYLSWDEIRALAAEGVEIEAHSVLHPHLPDLGEEEIRAEIRNSADRIEAETGRRPTLFAYPYGEANAAAIRIVQELGFKAAFGQHSGVMAPDLPRFYLPRFPVNEHYGEPALLAERMKGLVLPVTDVAPESPTVTPDQNPPHFGFTVTLPGQPLDRLACYRSDGGAINGVEVMGRRVELRFDSAFAQGRTRVNCTLPTPDGRWRWFGWQFYRGY